MADNGYKLRIESSLEDHQLTLVPHVAGPPGARLRYEMTSTKEGSAGKSSTSQSGTVGIGESGGAALSRLSVSVAPQDRYTITVKVFDGARLVAEETLRHPK